MSTLAPVGKPPSTSKPMIIGIVVVIILMVVGVGVYFITKSAGPSATGPSALGPSATGPSALGPSATGPSQYMGLLGPSATGPSQYMGLLGPSATGPSQYMDLLGPSATGPSALGPSALGPSATGPSALGPSALGPSATGPSQYMGLLGPSATGPSQYMGLPGPSATGPSRRSTTGPSRPSATGPSRRSTTGPSATGPSRPSATGPSRPSATGPGPAPPTTTVGNTSWTIEDNTDYAAIPGTPTNNLFHYHTTSNPKASEVVCLEKCKNTPNCKLVTFNKAKTLCWGKNNALSKQSHTDRISYFNPNVLQPSVTAPPAVAVPAPPAVAVPAIATTATVPKGRFIKLIQTVAYDNNVPGWGIDDRHKIINLAELEVFDANGVNLASGKKVTGNAEWSQYGYVNLTDGNKTNFTHTLGRNVNEYDYLQVDLGALKNIKKIVITNRTGTNAVKDRAIGIKAIIYANNGTTVVKETPMITTRADTYTLTFPENVWS